MDVSEITDSSPIGGSAASYPVGRQILLSASLAPDGTLTDADISFRVRDPNGNVSVFAESDFHVSHDGTGLWTCLLDPPTIPGDYHYDMVAVGAIQAILSGDFTIVGSSVVPADGDDIPIPNLGPILQWVSAEDVAAAAAGALIQPSDPRAADAAYMASQVLYEISGRLWPGLQTRIVRPKAQRCGCWGGSSFGAPWYWTSWPVSGAGPYGWLWRNEGGDWAGCTPISKVPLAGVPVREVLQVKIDGLPLDPADPSQRYRLDRRRWLTRMSTPGDPPTPNFWPACQDMTLPDTEPGTFSIAYTWGQEPPLTGKMAAAQLAAQFFLAMDGQACQLPAGVTQVVRQGVKMERGLFANFLDASKPTGLVLLDAFLRAYWRPKGSRRPAIWSPDRQQFPRPDGIYYDSAT